MRDVSCKLLSTIGLGEDNIGVQKKETKETEIPIIKVEDVYSKEFYEANELGHKPTLRIRTSSLNYNNEKELKYMNEIYSIIRTQEITADEIVLICERKIKNAKG